jgi:DNA-binding NarL/FixJ family response regulator
MDLFRILSVDDFEPWCRFVGSALQKQPELQMIGEASDGLEAVQKAQELQPDLILLDIGLPSVNGIEAARRIHQVVPGSKILFVSENRSPEIAEEALSTGACGYVVKSDAARELLPAVRAVLEGKRFVSTSLAGHDLLTRDTADAASEGNRSENNPYLQCAGSSAISEFLTSVIDATAADFGNVQLLDSTNQVLRIVAHHGFESEFLNYFDTVGYKNDCACGMAMNGRSRIVVSDVATDPLFSNDSRGVLLRAKVRSLQSTPLIDSLGKLVGMVSTHHRRPGSPRPHMLQHVDNLAASFLTKINHAANTREP